MAGQRVSVDMRGPVHPDTIARLLEDEGFEVDEIGKIPASAFDAEILSFIVERLDDAVVPVLVTVVTTLMAKRRSRSSPDEDDPVTFSIRGEDVGDVVVINVTGDGNWVQVHPRPSDEEE